VERTAGWAGPNRPQKEGRVRQQNLRAVMMLVLGALCWVPGAGAEPYVAFYGGYSLVSNTDLSADVTFPGAPTLDPNLNVVSTTLAARGVKLTTNVRDSAVFGGKIGYWFDFFPFVGAELDISTFSPDITVPSQPLGRTGFNIGPLQNGRPSGNAFKFNVSVVDIGVDIMGRYPLLQGPDFPRGRLQPYIGAGPALFVTSIEDTGVNGAANSLGSKSLTFGGFQVLGGVKFFLLKNLSLFAEYKFTHFTADLSGVPGGGTNLNPGFSLSATQHIDGSHFYGGLAYHFY
jgi:opacity protein-like surface antigen